MPEFVIKLADERGRIQEQSHTAQTADERETFEQKISVMRRLILGLDILVFAAIGYWIGKTVGD